jgi:FkbM family methyltransferase
MLEGGASQVHAFEPNPRTRSRLAFNCSLNRGAYTIHDCALSDRTETRTFFLGPESNVGLSSLVPYESAGVAEVRCVTADDFVRDQGLPPPSIMKMDVEGWELRVLQGSEAILRQNPPRAIVFEANPNDHDELFSFLTRLDFRVSHIARPSGALDVFENYLAVNNAALR